MKDIGIITLLSVIISAAAPSSPNALASNATKSFATAKSADQFASCFAGTQDRGALPWSYVRKEDGGTFSNLGLANDRERLFRCRLGPWLQPRSPARGERRFGNRGQPRGRPMRLRQPTLQRRVRRMTLRANAQSVQSTARRTPRRHAATAPRQPDPRPENCRRESPRSSVEAEVAVKKLGGFGFQLQALNVSAGGCRVELIEMVNSGEPVIVRLPALEPLGAEVAWVQGANAGLRFQRPLHPAVFDQLMDRFTACAA